MKKPKHTINSSLDSDPRLTIERDPSPEVLAAELDVPSAVLKVPVDLEMDLDDDQAKELVQAISDYLLRCGMGRPALSEARQKLNALSKSLERTSNAIDNLRETKTILCIYAEEQGMALRQLNSFRQRLDKAQASVQRWSESIPKKPPGNPGGRPIKELVKRLITIYNQTDGAARGTGGIVSFIRLVLEKCGEQYFFTERRIQQLVSEATKTTS